MNRNRVAAFLGPLAGGMDWAVASGEPSWGAAADQGPTMVSFGGPSSSIFPTAEIQFQDFSVGIVRRARPPGAGRRSRGAGSGGVPEACSVDGCRSDLSRCRDYHRRHKVCETHSKTPVVVVGGQEQRFCQQCSRFHMLSEFDEGKRSCRKRLDGHNRRRRKPQHDVMNFGGFFPYHQVNQFAVHPQSIPRSGQNSNCKHLVDCQQTFSISFSGTFKAPKALPFCQDGGSMLNALCSNNHPAAHGSHTRSISLSGTLAPECALSLLSSSLHHPSPTTDQAQVTSSLTCLVAAPQDATTTTTIPYASSVAYHGFVPDALFEDPSQPLPFIW